MARIVQNADLNEAAVAALTVDEREWVYNALDCAVTLEVHNALNEQMDDVAAATYDFSRALQAPILEMTLRGVRIDIARREEVLRSYRADLARVGENLTAIITEGVGISPFNWRSTAQLKHLFYTVMGYAPVKKRNAQGIMAPTVNREALEKLSDYYLAAPICLHLLTLRELDKKRQFLETNLDPDARIRSSFNIAGTNTGRLASSVSDFGTGTNVQNIDRELRSVFVADEGMKFANLDLEQADARNVGAICWDLFHDELGPAVAGKYLDACESGDLHTAVCRMGWQHLPWSDDPKANRAVADEIAYRELTYRDMAKRLGHGTNYLGTPRTMAKHAKVQVPLIEDFQTRYFRGFPTIRKWHEWVARSLRETGELITLLGRRRFFFGRADDAATQREAVAYAPQSMTADEIDRGILNLWRANRVQLLIQVHDSILLQYPEELEPVILPWALEALKTTIELKGGRLFTVPTEAKVGWNWGDRSDWTKRDFEKGLCTEAQIGTCKDNPDGLVKWKGHDERTRQRRLLGSLREML